MCNAQILMLKIIDGIYSIWFILLFWSYTSNLENKIFIKLSRRLYFTWTHWKVSFCGTSVYRSLKEFRHLIEIVEVGVEVGVGVEVRSRSRSKK